MLEQTLERYLVRRVQSIGGTCEKFVSPNRRSVPDRIVTLPGGRIIFVELKAPGKRATPLQAKDHALRREMGCTVLVLDSKEGVDDAFPK
jgi:hypothetical protein